MWIKAWEEFKLIAYPEKYPLAFRDFDVYFEKRKPLSDWFTQKNEKEKKAAES